jgi:hypothetical protein
MYDRADLYGLSYGMDIEFITLRSVFLLCFALDPHHGTMGPNFKARLFCETFFEVLEGQSVWLLGA